MPANNPLRVAWFSELYQSPGADLSYSAYCSSQLLPLLERQLEIELFSSAPGKLGEQKVSHYLTASQRHKDKPFDIFFYQLEDRKECQWLRILSCLQPGITYFHDFLFTTFGPEPILNSPWQGMIKAFNTKKEYWPELLDEQEQLGPQALREAAFAGVRVFSQPTALRESKKLVELHVQGEKDVPCYYLPFPIDEGLFGIKPAVKRRVLFCGTPWIQHRAQQLLEAIAEFDPGLSLAWLLNDAELTVARELCARLNLKQIEFVTNRSPQTWAELAKSGGLAVHTLFSVFGQNGPYLPVSLALGLPIIITRFADSEYIPEHLAYQIQAGESEVTEFCKVFDLVFNKQIVTSVEPLKDFARELFSCKQIANELLFIFKQEAEQLSNLSMKWQEFSEQASHRLLKQSKKLLPDASDCIGLGSDFVAAAYKEFQW